MAEPFLGEIRMFGFNYAPVGWVLCDGASLPIVQFVALYSLLQITYGGDGINYFKVPDLRGRVPIHMGQTPGLPAYHEGQLGGYESVALTTDQIPAHRHGLLASNANATLGAPLGNALANTGRNFVYGPDMPDQALNSDCIDETGRNQVHPNMPPYLCVNFCIATEGFYPPRQ
jgi:microcystin-dependent protein